MLDWSWPKSQGLGFRGGCEGSGTHWGNIRIIMENQMEKKMEHEKETGSIGFKGGILGYYSQNRKPCIENI